MCIFILRHLQVLLSIHLGVKGLHVDCFFSVSEKLVTWNKSDTGPTTVVAGEKTEKQKGRLLRIAVPLGKRVGDVCAWLLPGYLWKAFRNVSRVSL